MSLGSNQSLSTLVFTSVEDILGDFTLLPPEKKVGQQGTNLPQRRTLRSVRGGYANVNIVNAIFGLAVAVIMR